jgi:hypothetical protein
MICREVVQEGLPLNVGLYNALLFVTTGGNDWECYARDRPLPTLPEESADMLQTGSGMNGCCGICSS